MSKILETLKKVHSKKSLSDKDVLSGNDYIDVSTSFIDSFANTINHRRIPLIEAALIVGVATIVIFSTFLSHKTLLEVQRYKTSNEVAFQQMSNHQKKLTELHNKVVNDNRNLILYINQLGDELQTFKQKVGFNDKKISSLLKKNKELQESIEELKWSKQSLMNKFIETKSELSSLREQFELERGR